MKRSPIYHLVTAGMLTAIGIILPMCFPHVQNLGSAFLPMHIPVLLCGLLCGWQYGLASGILVPLLSSLLTSKPPFFPTAVSMMFELAAYGLIAAFAIQYYRKHFKYLASGILALVTAMVGGRIVMGIVNMILIIGVKGSTYTLSAFLTAAFVTALPGIVIQLVTIPVILGILKKAGFSGD